MEQCIEAGTDFHHIDVFHAVEEHVRNTDTAALKKKCSFYNEQIEGKGEGG